VRTSADSQRESGRATACRGIPRSKLQSREEKGQREVQEGQRGNADASDSDSSLVKSETREVQYMKAEHLVSAADLTGIYFVCIRVCLYETKTKGFIHYDACKVPCIYLLRAYVYT
jgi:hypothetical protein